MESITQEKFLRICKGFIKKHPSKNTTGMCCDCFLWHIQRNENYKNFINPGFNVTTCYSIASFLQEKGIIKIKSGIESNSSINCFKLSFLVLQKWNKI